MAKKWIQNLHEGTLTKQAKAAGMTVSQFMAHPPKGITTVTKKRIAAANTLAKLRPR